MEVHTEPVCPECYRSDRLLRLEWEALDKNLSIPRKEGLVARQVLAAKSKHLEDMRDETTLSTAPVYESRGPQGAIQKAKRWVVKTLRIKQQRSPASLRQ